MRGGAPFRVKVGSGFTITIPEEVRDMLGINVGDELELIVEVRSIILRKRQTLLELIDSIALRGSVEQLLKLREEEDRAESERILKLTK
ncbi:MAG: AbrB/MazE/SpoVT family DNA-binding domain-containing protein [Sulfolobales archaeon]